jgi:hypothetical protein
MGASAALAVAEKVPAVIHAEGKSWERMELLLWAHSDGEQRDTATIPADGGLMTIRQNRKPMPGAEPLGRVVLDLDDLRAIVAAVRHYGHQI